MEMRYFKITRVDPKDAHHRRSKELVGMIVTPDETDRGKAEELAISGEYELSGQLDVVFSPTPENFKNIYFFRAYGVEVFRPTIG
jgi:hypothetical protein